MHILTIEDVCKNYQAYKALDHVSLKVKEGSIFGLLGPNGAGKTSLIRIITNITKQDSGKLTFGGQDLDMSQARLIGYMPEERGLYKKMKVADHLMYLAQLRGLSKSDAQTSIKKWFDKLDMASWWNKKIEELSKGMQQKVQFVATVAHNPKLLILDEPFSGLDPVNAELLKQEIYQLNQEGTTIIFSTHRMEQVEEICDDIVLINKGVILLNDSVSNVKQQFKENKYELKTIEEVPNHSISTIANVVNKENQALTVTLKEGHSANALLKEVINQNINITAFREILPSMNEIFIKLVKTSK
jgi:ABC-2 type transport system ATP-binding protein